MKNYDQQKSYYKRKNVSVQFSLEGDNISDVLRFVYCSGTKNIYVYNVITIHKKGPVIGRICENLIYERLTDDIIINKLKHLLKENPGLSQIDIAKLIGCNKERISRLYMTAKRNLVR